MLRELIYHVDPFEIIEDMGKLNILFPSLDNTEEIEHEFSPELY